MKQRKLALVGTILFALFAITLAVVILSNSNTATDVTDPSDSATPVLSIVTISPKHATLPATVTANGSIMPWQEASIDNQGNGLRLADVMVDVGDTVEQNQLLATFVTDTALAELEQSHASVEEARALLIEARTNAERARNLASAKALSEQQVQQYFTAEQTAEARLRLAEATEKTKQVQLAQTQVVAPDKGIISERIATIGAVPSAGDELFRLFRQGRLEWRAEIAASDLNKLKSGQMAHITLKGGSIIKGTLRQVSPVVDRQTLNGLIYVDLPKNAELRAGMYAHGTFEVDRIQSLTLPQSAVFQRDGFSYVFSVNQNSRVEKVKVTTGIRSGKLIEILNGVDSRTRVVATGAGFLGDGDLVNIVENKTEVVIDGSQGEGL